MDVYDNCGKGEGAVDGNHHRIVDLMNPAQPAAPSEAKLIPQLKSIALILN
jgi:hypothetical protein